MKLTRADIEALNEEACCIVVMTGEDHTGAVCDQCAKLYALRDLARDGLRVPRLLELLRLLDKQYQHNRYPHPWLIGAVRRELAGQSTDDLTAIDAIDDFRETHRGDIATWEAR